MNLNKVMQLVAQSDADALILCNEANMHYVCDFSPSEGMILVTEEAGWHFVDSRYTETAMQHAKNTHLQVTEVNGDFSEALLKVIKQNRIQSLLFEEETISYKRYTLFKEALQLPLRPVGNGLAALRSIKEPDEIVWIKKANAIAEKAFMELLNDVKPGRTEKELAARFDYLMAKNGSNGVSFDTILLTGAHTSMPHGVPGDAEIKPGDFVLFDFGATYQGYHSDMTRTVAVQSATQEMKECYQLVLAAQMAGIAALEAGKKCSAVYQAAYDVLEEQGMGKYFRHSLGHGVGLEIHEGCNVSPKSTQSFETGNVTSIEPGIYLPDKFGIRIEDLLYLSPRGRENLSGVTKQLMIL